MKWITLAHSLVSEYVTQPNLLRHLKQVALCMKWHAFKFNEDVDLWESVGLLHDFDYELHPEPDPPDGHPYFAAKKLAELNYPEDGINAILSHAKYTGVKRDTLLAKTLFAVDELSGFIDACWRVHPSRNLKELTPGFVLKRMKEKSFARGCSREDLEEGASELGLSLEDHISNCLQALSQFCCPEQM